jgi:hypothetical protein
MTAATLTGAAESTGPFVVLQRFHEEVEAQGLFFPPDPSSLGSCRLGGNVAQPNTATPTLPRDLLTWHDNTRVRWAAFGTDAKLYAYRFDVQTLYNITPAGVGPLDPPG